MQNSLTKNGSLKKTVCVSYPRSGHHLLINMLFKYYSGNTEFPTVDVDDCHRLITAGEFSYCEYYRHCSKGRYNTFVPCPSIPVVQKYHGTHGFGINKHGHEFVTDYNVIIQHRSPVPATISNYERMLVQRRKRDGRLAWNYFLHRSLKLWKLWVKRWVHSDPGPLSIDYDDLIREPSTQLARVIASIEPGHEVDWCLLHDAIRASDVRPGRKITDFRYCDSRLVKLHNKMENWRPR